MFISFQKSLKLCLRGHEICFICRFIQRSYHWFVTILSRVGVINWVRLVIDTDQLLGGQCTTKNVLVVRLNSSISLADLLI